MASKDEGPPIPAATLGAALSTPALDTALSVSTEAPPTFQAWQVDCWQWLSRKVAESELKTLHPKAHRTAGVRSFYREQNELIDAFNAHARIMNDDPATPRVPPADGLSDSETVVGRALALSLAMNVVLFVLKAVAALASGSMAVLASAVDSLLDLLSGSVLFVTNRLVRDVDPILYPESKDRLEPVGVILFATVMGISSLQIVVESAGRVRGDRPHLTLDAFTIGCLSATIVVKAALAVYCDRIATRHKSSAVRAQADDHRNDVLTNVVGFVAVAVAVQVHSLWLFDPIGAIIIALWIIKSWAETGAEQVSFLTGATAPPHFLSLCTFIAYNHHEAVLKVDTVRAYHFGTKFLVEVDIVLPEDMPLKQTHDISEALQLKLEALGDVQRAFVHPDYEWEHAPEHRNVSNKRD